MSEAAPGRRDQRNVPARSRESDSLAMQGPGEVQPNVDDRAVIDVATEAWRQIVAEETTGSIQEIHRAAKEAQDALATAAEHRVRTSDLSGGSKRAFAAAADEFVQRGSQRVAQLADAGADAVAEVARTPIDQERPAPPKPKRGWEAQSRCGDAIDDTTQRA